VNSTRAFLHFLNDARVLHSPLIIFLFVVTPGPFQNFLELVPSLRELVHAVVTGNYGPAMATLDGLEGQLMLDLHLKVYAYAVCADVYVCVGGLKVWCIHEAVLVPCYE